MTNAIREFEVRLFDRQGHQFLIVPVMAETEAEARVRAEGLRRTHGAARYELKAVGRALPARARDTNTRDST